ncbi:hypothetical protein Fot_28106 [Forsythia ovata]|uniref:Uncharacterized protein n=1 Tax=Forsythia ovata TaxID=205694 RepID=A0ABD1TN28_9LAMI
MGVVGPSGAENPMEEEDVSPRIRKVTLRLTSDEMDRLEDWVEYVRDLSGGHKDPELDLNYWACNKYPTELKKRAKQAKKKKAEARHKADPEAGRSSKQSLRDEDDLEILEEEGLARKTKKPLTAFFKSLQNQLVEGVETFTAHEAVDPSVPEEKDYDHLVHVTKILEGRANDISSEVLGMLPNHIQRATVTIDSFWTDSWVAYSAKLSVGAKLIAAKALAAGSIVTMN